MENDKRSATRGEGPGKGPSTHGGRRWPLRWPLRLGLALGTGGLALALTELSLRMFLGPPEWVVVTPAEPSAETGPLDLTTETRAAFDLHIRGPHGVRLRPNTVALTKNHRLSGLDVEVRVNSLGLRNPELGPKLAERPRVLCLGDSITFAGYLPEDRTWVRQLERRTAAFGNPVETVNAGIGAVGLEAELALLIEIGAAVQPDLVLLAFYLNDVQNSPGLRVLRPPPALEWSRLARLFANAIPALAPHGHSPIGPELRASWMEEVALAFPPGPGDPLHDRAAFNARIQEAGRDWGSAWSEHAWQRLEPLLAETERAARRLGAPLAIVCFPVRLQVESEVLNDYPQRRLAALAQRLDVHYLDLLPALRAVHRGASEPLFFDHCHPTDHGSEVIAQVLTPLVMHALR